MNVKEKLNRLLENSFEGSRKLMSAKTGISVNAIYKITSGDRPLSDRMLTGVCSAIPLEDAVELCRYWVADKLPDKVKESFVLDDEMLANNYQTPRLENREDILDALSFIESEIKRS